MARWQVLLCVMCLALAAGTAGQQRENAPTPQEPVDAITFVRGVLGGRADEFKGRTIAGTGADLHGSWNTVTLTLGAWTADGGFKAITTREEFMIAQQARTTFVIDLKVPGFTRQEWPRGDEPVPYYRFNGVFTGVMRTVPRVGVPPNGKDDGPCSGQPPVNIVATGDYAYHCVPVLEDVKIERLPAPDRGR